MIYHRLPTPCRRLNSLVCPMAVARRLESPLQHRRGKVGLSGRGRAPLPASVGSLACPGVSSNDPHQMTLPTLSDAFLLYLVAFRCVKESIAATNFTLGRLQTTKSTQNTPISRPQTPGSGMPGGKSAANGPGARTTSSCLDRLASLARM